jgi:hypothetical protein
MIGDSGAHIGQASNRQIYPHHRRETLDATFRGKRQRLRLRIPYVSLAGLTSIIDFHAEATAEAKMLVLEKMFDNSMLQEIEKEMTSKRQRS